MKKLCIVLNGLARLSTEVHVEIIENYKKQFSWADNPDIWFFTWKLDDKEKESILRSHVYKLIAVEESPTSEQLDNIGIPYTKQLLDPRWSDGKQCRVAHYAAVYGPSYTFDKIIESGEEYEYALRGRNDLYFEGDTFKWYEAVLNNPSAYVSPPNYWCGGPSNDHIGFGKFEIVRNIWKYDNEDFKKTLADCWNPETYTSKMIQRYASYIVLPVDSYRLKRAANHIAGGQDWIMKG